jgi:Cytochrome c oxidase biogenesis protein Cmc1 like
MQESDEKNILVQLAKQERNYYIRKYCPEFKPEADTYTVKTRPPHYIYNWKINWLRRAREEDLRDEAMQASRLKCHASANAFSKCSFENSMKEATMCKDSFKAMKSCFVQEMNVEMDKRRRDIERNKEWWWTNIYDENGEIGEQAKTPPDTYVEKVVGACYWIRESFNKLLNRKID